MKQISLIVAIAASLLLSSCNETGRGNDSNLGEDRDEAAAESNNDKYAGKIQRDADFVYEVVASSYGEIKLAELANQKSRTSEVQQIAGTLLTDHTASLNELKTIAQSKAISVPVQEPQEAINKLENIADESGEDFDEAWCREMIDVHEANIEKFEERLDDTEDAELKAYITKTLPVLKKHRESLQMFSDKLEKKS